MPSVQLWQQHRALCNIFPALRPQPAGFSGPPLLKKNSSGWNLIGRQCILMGSGGGWRTNFLHGWVWTCWLFFRFPRQVELWQPGLNNLKAYQWRKNLCLCLSVPLSISICGNLRFNQNYVWFYDVGWGKEQRERPMKKKAKSFRATLRIIYQNAFMGLDLRTGGESLKPSLGGLWKFGIPILLRELACKWLLNSAIYSVFWGGEEERRWWKQSFVASFFGCNDEKRRDCKISSLMIISFLNIFFFTKKITCMLY